jgi:hypothetical protein
MAKWLFAALLVLQAHFAASYLVPLDREAQATFGGLLRWAWPCWPTAAPKARRDRGIPLTGAPRKW